MKGIWNYTYLFVVVLIVGAVIVFSLPGSVNNGDMLYASKPGEPIAGLTAEQRKLFYESERIFKHDFTVEEGLGPLFNGTSCFECHGKPLAAGLEGRDVSTTGVVRIGGLVASSPFNKDLKRAKEFDDIYDFGGLLDKGGPAIQRRTVTMEFPNKFPHDCNIEIGTVPPEARFISLRHAGPLLGFGLIEAIDERTILKNMMDQARDNPDLAGRTSPIIDPLTQRTRIGRFGWKCQNPDMVMFTAEALNTEMGVTTYLQSLQRSALGIIDFPKCTAGYLPAEPNDRGRNLIMLAYFQSLLAPPAAPVLDEQSKRGKKVFEKLRCSVCHTPEMSTPLYVAIPDPRSEFPKLEYMEIESLENKPVRLYSDLLLHQMGPELADGIVQVTARGGEWRTTPLWGLRHKKFLLHNGKAKTINEAIVAHGGQAQLIKQNYLKLSEKDRLDLLAFLRAL